MRGITEKNGVRPPFFKKARSYDDISSLIHFFHSLQAALSLPDRLFDPTILSRTQDTSCLLLIII